MEGEGAGPVAESGWPLTVLEDPAKCSSVSRVDSVAEFRDFVRHGRHSEGEMCILTEGISKLQLTNSIPETLSEVLSQRKKLSAVEALLKTIEQGEDPWTGELFWWPPGETRREEVLGEDLRSKLLRYRPFVETCYAAELRSSRRGPHPRSCEQTDTLTSLDVKDLVTSHGSVPLWDRGHGFLGSSGAGIGLHVDQAWWSNIAKNFYGYKLVALWAPGSNVLETCGGELFRKPLCHRHLSALDRCCAVALLRPGDVACFTGGLPHTTLVVGSELNLTFYESFVNWNCDNLALLLSGLQRPIDQAWWQNNMSPEFAQTVLDDILRVVDAGGKLEEFQERFVSFLRSRPIAAARLAGKVRPSGEAPMKRRCLRS
ncbi:unnamed protein product [Durusdinium trenchii]|uniref:Uncharacterized protein n=2 Tax=Durusdinium trenchii TaxID=1381693 RepID=A0ABP0IEV5_9DINO